MQSPLFMLAFLCLGFLDFSHGITDIVVGGMFNHFNSAGQIDYDQLEHLMAFLMAIDEINNNSTFLPGYTIQYVIGNGLNFGHGASSEYI